LNVRQGALDAFRGAQHGRQETVYLGFAAAGKKTDQPLIRIESETLKHLTARHGQIHDVKKRMAHIADLFDADRFAQVLFKGENHEQPLGHLLECIDAAAVPGPHLGHDVIDDGNAALPGGLHDLEVESGIINENDSIGPVFIEKGAGLAIQPEDALGVTEYARKTDDGQSVHNVGQKIDSGLLHLLSPKAVYAQLRIKFQELAHQVGAVKIAGVLPGYDEEITGAHVVIFSLIWSEICVIV